MKPSTKISTMVICILAAATLASPIKADESLTTDTAATTVAYQSVPTLYGIPTITGPRDLSWKSVGNDPMNRICPQIYVDHPYIDLMRNTAPMPSEPMRASFYGNNYHGGPLDDEDRVGNARFHECDATVVAYNGLPRGTVLRLTNRSDEETSNGRVILVVIQDSGGEMVGRRLDLSRGAAEALDPLYWEKGVLQVDVEILGHPKGNIDS